MGGEGKSSSPLPCLPGEWDWGLLLQRNVVSECPHMTHLLRQAQARQPMTAGKCCMVLPRRKIGCWSTVASPKCEDLLNLNGSAVQIHEFPWMNKHQTIIADFYLVTRRMKSKVANSRNVCSVLMRFPEAIMFFQCLVCSWVV